nr:MAG TPA: hypothetical protein [Caudoviricetes sp.]
MGLDMPLLFCPKKIYKNQYLLYYLFLPSFR